jgi:hypothetical protein
MTYTFEYTLSHQQLKVGMVAGGQDLLKRGASPASWFLQNIQPALITAGGVAIVWLVYFFVTQDPSPPTAVAFIGGVLGALAGIFSPPSFASAMARAVKQNPGYSAPSTLTVSETDVETVGQGVRFAADWSAVERIVRKDDCTLFLSAGLVYILPDSEVTDREAFLKQVTRWHKDATT